MGVGVMRACLAQSGCGVLNVGNVSKVNEDLIHMSEKVLDLL